MAPYGRYLELSKRDIVANSAIGMAVLGDNLAIHGVDVVHMIHQRPVRAGAILRAVCELIDQGALQPLPYQEFPATAAAEAFRLMSRARHVGKILLTFTNMPTRDVAAGAPAAGEMRIHSNATYLVTGGAGGIGGRLAHWLVDKGARHLLLTGRRAVPDGAGTEALDGLRARGVTVRYTAVDVADRAAMTDMLLAYRRSGAPAIRGVFHAAGVVDYDSVSDLEPDRLAAVLAPKLAGGWNLHRAFDDGSVDYFVLFSSASALLSSPLLAGYAAGNAFLDALAHHRRARNLAATTVNWGFWDSVGMVVRHERDTGRTVLPQGMSRFSPEDAFTVLEHVLTRDLAQVAVLPADWAAWARAYPAAATAPLLREILQDEGRFSPGVPRAQATRPAVEDEAPVTAAPSTVTSPARDDEVERYLVAEVSRVLGIQPERINPKRPLNRSGMDSLMATELRTHLERTFKVKLPMVKLLNGASIADLTALIAGTGESPAEEPVPPTVAGPDGEPDGEVEQYVVAEVSRILGVQPERINPKRPLSRSGMDSLMATELRTHLERKYKVKLPMVKLLNTATVADLVSLISGSGAGGRNGGAA